MITKPGVKKKEKIQFIFSCPNVSEPFKAGVGLIKGFGCEEGVL